MTSLFRERLGCMGNATSTGLDSAFSFSMSTRDLDGQVVIQLVPLGERSTRVLIDYDGDPFLRPR